MINDNFLKIEQTHHDLYNTGYYMLQKVGKSSSEIKLFLKTTDGETEYTDFKTYKMNDGNVLLVINKIKSLFADYNMVARDDYFFEIVNTQLFERLYKYYNILEKDKKGFFIFENSVPVPEDGYGWRCDKNRFGPQFFMKNDVDYDPLFADSNEIIVYEPVLSISDTAHIIYVHGTKDLEVEKFHLEEYELPRAAKTLPELFKLIIEWSEVSEEPWNNKENISIKAKTFLEKIDFSDKFINEIKTLQQDMQIVKFLKNDENAKQQNLVSGTMTAVMDEEIKKKTSHYSLSNLLSLFPGCIDNISSIYDEELLIVKNLQKVLINELNLDFDKFYASQSSEVIEAFKTKKNNTGPAQVIYINCLASHMSILESLGD